MGDREPIDDIPLDDFPAPGTEYKEFFLHSNKLHASVQTEPQTLSYDSEQHLSTVSFDHTFDTKARLIGLPKITLYMSCPSRDDFTVFVILRKKDKNGKDLMHLNFPFSATHVKSIDDIPEKDRASLNLHLGSTGVLRASHRAIDEKRSIHPQFPFHPHTKQEKVEPGTVVKLEIGIWAMGVDFDEGESISVRVCISSSCYLWLH
jgi:predicted acyl esterase